MTTPGHSLLFHIQKGKREVDNRDVQGESDLLSFPLRP